MDYDPKKEVYMTEARRTSIEERKEIVDYCLKHNRDYKESASIYDVSYSQVYSWVKKYDARYFMLHIILLIRAELHKRK